MRIDFVKPEQAEELNAFVAAHPYGSIEQSWEWGVLQTTIPGRDAFYVFGVWDKEGLIASMLVIRQEAWLGKHWLWCPRGPLLPEAEKGAGDSHVKAAWDLLSKACEAVARKEGDLFLRIEPGVAGGATGNQEELPWESEGRSSKECYLPENTLLVDLSVSEESIKDQMTQKGRYNIKKARKADVHVRKSSGEELNDFYDILKETAKRDGFYLHKKAFYEQFLDLLDGQVHFYAAYVDHEMIGGMLVAHFGKTATYYFGASANEHRNKMAPYALQWFAMQEAKAAGMLTYDFLGIAPKDDDSHVLAGVTQFKTRFGGKRRAYKKARLFVYRKTWWNLYRMAKYIRQLL